MGLVCVVCGFTHEFPLPSIPPTKEYKSKLVEDLLAECSKAYFSCGTDCSK